MDRYYKRTITRCLAVAKLSQCQARREVNTLMGDLPEMIIPSVNLRELDWRRLWVVM